MKIQKQKTEQVADADLFESDASKGESSKSDASKGDASKGDASKGESSKGDASKSESSKGDASKSESNKGVKTKDIACVEVVSLSAETVEAIAEAIAERFARVAIPLLALHSRLCAADTIHTMEKPNTVFGHAIKEANLVKMEIEAYYNNQESNA